MRSRDKIYTTLFVELEHQSSVGVPPVNRGRLYFKDDGHCYIQRSDGTEVILGEKADAIIGRELKSNDYAGGSSDLKKSIAFYTTNTHTHFRLPESKEENYLKVIMSEFYVSNISPRDVVPLNKMLHIQGYNYGTTSCTGGSASHLTMIANPYTNNDTQYIAYCLSGTNVGSWRIVSSRDSDNLYFADDNWDNIPASGDTFQINQAIGNKQWEVVLYHSDNIELMCQNKEGWIIKNINKPIDERTNLKLNRIFSNDATTPKNGADAQFQGTARFACYA